MEPSWKSTLGDIIQENFPNLARLANNFDIENTKILFEKSSKFYT